MAVNIRNRCFNNRTGVTPVELLAGKRPNLMKMNIFGTRCFAHDSEAGKLDPKCKEGVFVGHDSESPAYLVYFPHTQSVRKIRNVKFTSQAPKVMVQTQKPSESSVIEIPDSENTKSEVCDDPTESQEVEEPSDSGKAEEKECQRRYPTRERNKPEYLKDFVTNVTHDTFIHHCYRASVQEIPNTYEEAVSSPESRKWKKAMDKET